MGRTLGRTTGAHWGTRGRRKVARTYTCTAPRLRSLVCQTKDILVDYISKVNFTTRNQRPSREIPLCEGTVSFMKPRSGVCLWIILIELNWRAAQV